jgi:hypothetical protein
MHKCPLLGVKRTLLFQVRASAFDPKRSFKGHAEQAIFNFENSPRTKFANQLQTVALPKTATKGKANE